MGQITSVLWKQLNHFSRFFFIRKHHSKRIFEIDKCLKPLNYASLIAIFAVIIKWQEMWMLQEKHEIVQRVSASTKEKFWSFLYHDAEESNTYRKRMKWCVLSKYECYTITNSPLVSLKCTNSNIVLIFEKINVYRLFTINSKEARQFC